VAYADNVAVGAVAVLNYDSLEILEQHTAVCEVKMPYISTLLSFRETPASMKCIRRLKLKPDVFLADAHGLAHPYRCGFASHLGLVLGKPTVGVAKNRLDGKTAVIDGNVSLVDNDQIVGAVVRTRENVNPVYVSVGHLISLPTAVKIVKHCARTSRTPEPLLHAHRIATAEKQKLQKP
jgi:deoxyribonuclease V